MIDTGSLLFLAGVALLAALIISSPLFNREFAEKNLNNKNEDHREQLAEVRLLIKATEDALEGLDIDRVMSKILERDFHDRRIKIVEELELLHAQEQRIEAILRYNTEQEAAIGESAENPLGREHELEELISTYRRARNVKAVGMCPNCGQAFLSSDRFCGKCGASLQIEMMQ